MSAPQRQSRPAPVLALEPAVDSLLEDIVESYGEIQAKRERKNARARELRRERKEERETIVARMREREARPVCGNCGRVHSW